MYIVIWLLLGGLVGWTASVIMRTDGQHGVFLNVLVGVVGAALAGWFVNPFLADPTVSRDSFSMATVLVSLLGAVILLAVVSLIQRVAAR